MPTATHSDRCLETFHFKRCKWLVGNWTVSIWTSFDFLGGLRLDTNRLDTSLNSSQRLNSGKLLGTGRCCWWCPIELCPNGGHPIFLCLMSYVLCKSLCFGPCLYYRYCSSLDSIPIKRMLESSILSIKLYYFCFLLFLYIE